MAILNAAYRQRWLPHLGLGGLGVRAGAHALRARSYATSPTTSAASSTLPPTPSIDKFKILFCGSDEFSVASLRAVHAAKDLWETINVVVPPERETGRGGKHHHKSHELYTPVLRSFAEEHNLTTTTVPAGGIKTWDPPSPFTELSKSHLLLTASFGHIIPLRLLKLFPPDHRLNVHPSLLPRWRGAAPVQWTIASGDGVTGVNVQRLVRYGLGVDAGDIVGAVRDIPVPGDATYNTFLPHLAEVGGDLLVDVLRTLKNGTATFTPQDERYITLAPKITHELAKIRWSEQTAQDIDRLNRGISHQCPLWTSMNGTTAQLLALRMIPSSDLPPKVPSDSVEPGVGYLLKQGKSRRLLVSCAEGTWVEVSEIQVAGKKALKTKEWVNGLSKEIRDTGMVKFSP
ncbi:methionyl-tRNA formyltransferase [Kwoniella heveanensis BCC8398]|uniref:methionyl-tRNA formyltransferase n=1 Tax=Kwoniella heveanensis BCC8398 TaxID=1296120 RepID=A0A1B9H3R5_9TREE|nr:methionyl-tRNA formyltransferase [Kwoniella heveanensis BCC8398]